MLELGKGVSTWQVHVVALPVSMFPQVAESAKLL